MGKETPNPPKPPKYNPIDIPALMQRAIDYDTQGYDLSDVDFAARFPGLVASRGQQLDDAYKQLTGDLDPTVENSFVTNALQGVGSAFGGGDPMAALGMTDGSAAKNAAAASVANQTLQKQDYDRTYFDQLLAENPQRGFGISGSDVANMAMANSGALNSNNQMQYQSQLSGIYAQGQQGAQTGQNIAAIGALIAQLGKAYSDIRLKHSIKLLGWKGRIPIVSFSYLGQHKTYIGTIAQCVQRVAPHAVSENHGYLMVDYSQI